ncbi:hypothetical protein K2Z83_13465 [Oscillochloris sp. ZM17-4]|uniref:hypothetical protein n=1 Tax=Oscillochloris sp. ZM17-4 TaxID=2866714 RepID=UPI001C736B61|nr:hypothetical protein [Oscillochloris sp. ZM17-4]MBX0328685.1 hypothetical protein [Oscillochloris sp. ZM17-4]
MMYEDRVAAYGVLDAAAMQGYAAIPPLRTKPLYAMAYDPAMVAMQLRAVMAAAANLAERELANPDAEVQAVLAELGRSSAFARLQLYARRAHHRGEVEKVEREMLVAAIAEVGAD